MISMERLGLYDRDI